MTKKFVLAPDSFKESMNAKEACLAMEKGILAVFEDADIRHVPMADGGEGTVDSLVDAIGGTRVPVRVAGPLSDQIVETYYGLLSDQETVVIEIAKANGIELVKATEHNPLITSTYDTGEMIQHALNHGVKKTIIGIGGGVTNDGGAGMIQALGARLLDKEGQELTRDGGVLDKLTQIGLTQFGQHIFATEVLVASDVSNPLTGPTEASHISDPQKGATEETVAQLDKNLTHYAVVIKKEIGIGVEMMPSAGAAGGSGAGLLAFIRAQLRPGIDIVIEVNQLGEKIKAADYVFASEGGMDFQTRFGKVPYGVSRLAKKYQKPIFACAGYIDKDVDVLYEEGMTAIFGILAKAESLEVALKNGPVNLERTVENIARALQLVPCD